MIRKANISDAQSIVKININEWKNTYNGIFPKNVLANLESKYDESVIKCQNKINEYLVYEKDNKIVGFLRFGVNKKGYENNYAEIYALYVDSDYQDLGIGKDLVNYLKKLLLNSYDFILVSTLKENNANNFYQKIGCEKIATCEFKLEDEIYEENLYVISIKK